MKFSLAALCLLVSLSANAANFPFIRLGNTTNQVTDSGTSLTRNGVAVGGGATGANPTATVATTAINGTSTNFMRADAAPAIPAAFIQANQTNVAAANPTATVGTSAVNGTAGTFMRSDASPAIPASFITANQTNVVTTNFVAKTGDTMTAPLQVPIGSGTAAGLQLGAANNGIYGETSTQVGIVVGGTKVVQIAASTVRIASSTTLDWGAIAGVSDLSLVRDSAATLQLGIDAATATAQTLKAHDGSGTDKAGADLTLEGGQSTGTGTSGALNLATALTGEASGSTVNAYSIRYHAKAKFVALTHATATEVIKFSLPANKLRGGTITALAYATNSTPHLQALTSVISFQAVAVGTNITATISQVDSTTAASSGTLTCAYTIVDNTDNTFSIKANASSSLSSPVERCKLIVTGMSGTAATTITDP